MSNADIIVGGSAILCLAAVIIWAISVIIADRRYWREGQKRGDARAAENERRAMIDKTIWGAQIPPPTTPETAEG